MKKISYKKSGVDVGKADMFVKNIKGVFGQKKPSGPSAFGSIFDFKPLLKKYGNPVLVSSTDGVGTKLKIAQQLGIHNTVGEDLVAMNVNDVICLGAKPLFFLDYIACGKVKIKELGEVIKSINKGLIKSDCLLLGGETAEMPGMYKKDEYDLAGFCVGVVDRKKLIDGSKIKKGDVIIGIESSGLHSNGFSLVRAALSSAQIKKYSKALLVPTRIYVKSILSLLSRLEDAPFAVKGIAHVTGGAFYNKATKILPQSLGMVVNKNSWRVPGIFKIIQDAGNISDKEMYSVFNMGIGMILVVDRNKSMRIISNLNRDYKTYLIGEVVKSDKKMLLV